MGLQDALTPDQVEFWESRYRSARTVWDLGQPCPALASWLASEPGGRGRALVTGCGRGYDAVALAEQGYGVTAIDFAASAIAEARELAGDRPNLHLIVQDLFELGQEFDHSFDLVFEHTCLCAIPPERWSRYAAIMARILVPDGRLLGAFFTGFDAEGPPFGIGLDDLSSLFAPAFDLVSCTPVPGEPEHLVMLVRR